MRTGCINTHMTGYSIFACVRNCSRSGLRRRQLQPGLQRPRGRAVVGRFWGAPCVQRAWLIHTQRVQQRGQARLRPSTCMPASRHKISTTSIPTGGLPPCRTHEAATHGAVLLSCLTDGRLRRRLDGKARGEHLDELGVRHGGVEYELGAHVVRRVDLDLYGTAPGARQGAGHHAWVRAAQRLSAVCKSQGPASPSTGP